MGDDGQVYLSGAPLSGELLVQWGDGANSRCIAHYVLPKQSLQQAVTVISAVCTPIDGYAVIIRFQDNLQFTVFLQQNFNRHSDDRMSIHNDHRRWFHSYQSHRSGQFSVRAVNCTLIHENTGFLDSDAQRCVFVCRYSEINQKIRRGRSLVQQPDQKPLTQQGLTV